MSFGTWLHTKLHGEKVAEQGRTQRVGRIGHEALDRRPIARAP